MSYEVGPLVSVDVPDDAEGGWVECAIATYLPVSEEMALDAGWWPWRRPDPNPMPFVVCSDLLDRALAVWGEARLRFWVAADVIRHGPDWVWAADVIRHGPDWVWDNRTEET